MASDRRGGPTRREALAGLSAAAALAAPVSVSGRTALPPGPVWIPSAAPEAAGLSRAFNGRRARRPALRALCASAADAAAAVRWARDQGRRFALRSSGHCFGGFSQHDDLVIDMRSLDGVAVDDTGRRARVGPGARLGAVAGRLASVGRALPLGVCPSVAMAGYVLGGGLGVYARVWGLGCDALQAVDMVDAEGRVRRIDPTTDPDLLWACRGGGGGGFGLVTALECALGPAPCALETTTLDFRVTLDQATEMAAAWAEWAPDAPPEVRPTLEIRPKGDRVLALRAQTTSVGGAAALAAAERRLAGLAPLSRDPIRRRDAPAAAAAVDRSGGADAGYWLDMASAVAPRGAGEAAFRPLLAALSERRPSGCAVVFEALGGAIDRIDPVATAFPHRAGAGFVIQVSAAGPGPADRPAWSSAVAAVKRALRTAFPGGGYVNYPDLSRPDWRDAYWGANVDRLSAIKARVDPDDVFRHAQSVRPAAR